MSKVYQYMTDDEAMPFCWPRLSDRVAIASHEASIAGLMIDGVDLPVTAANLDRAARVVWPDYQIYGRSAAEVLRTDWAVLRDDGCKACPWRDDCDAMDDRDVIRQYRAAARRLTW